MLPALRRPPCLVSFSGGLDSSLVLAVATQVARRTGLPDPIPCSWRFRDAPAAFESGWQQRVVSALGLSDWMRPTVDDDLDLIGPVAQQVLRRYGILHPVNVHLHLPVLEWAATGSVLTGVGGDQVLGGWRRASPLGVRRRLVDRVPGSWRALAPKHAVELPWLRPQIAHHVVAARLAERSAEPRRFDHRVRWHLSRRGLRLGRQSLARLAADHDVRLVNPLLDPDFVAALGERVGSAPAPRRAALLSDIVTDRLPPVVIAPRPKARFGEVFFRAPTRELVRSWDGSGVDCELVDPAALQRAWTDWPIPGGTAALVQQVFLATNPTGATPAAHNDDERTDHAG